MDPSISPSPKLHHYNLWCIFSTFFFPLPLPSEVPSSRRPWATSLIMNILGCAGQARWLTCQKHTFVRRVSLRSGGWMDGWRVRNTNPLKYLHISSLATLLPCNYTRATDCITSLYVWLVIACTDACMCTCVCMYAVGNLYLRLMKKSCTCTHLCTSNVSFVSVHPRPTTTTHTHTTSHHPTSTRGCSTMAA